MLKLVWIKRFDNNHDAPYANCWALTMLICGGIRRPTWAHVDQVEEWLEDKTHDIDDAPRAGDIFIMRSRFARGRDRCMEHTAVYMGNGIYWHKPGADVGQYTTMADMQEQYPEATICYHVRLNNAKDVDTAKKIDRQIKSLLKDAA